jgi:hypothetical protein
MHDKCPLSNRYLWANFMDTYRQAETTFRLGMRQEDSSLCLVDLRDSEELMKSSILTLEFDPSHRYAKDVQSLAKEVRRVLWTVETHRMAIETLTGDGGKKKPVVPTLVRLAAIKVIVTHREASVQRLREEGLWFPAEINAFLTQPAGPQSSWVSDRPPLNMSQFHMFGLNERDDDRAIRRAWRDEAW